MKLKSGAAVDNDVYPGFIVLTPLPPEISWGGPVMRICAQDLLLRHPSSFVCIHLVIAYCKKKICSWM
jgi:hypothetical protein